MNWLLLGQVIKKHWPVLVIVVVVLALTLWAGIAVRHYGDRRAAAIQELWGAENLGEAAITLAQKQTNEILETNRKKQNEEKEREWKAQQDLNNSRVDGLRRLLSKAVGEVSASRTEEVPGDTCPVGDAADPGAGSAVLSLFPEAVTEGLNLKAQLKALQDEVRPQAN